LHTPTQSDRDANFARVCFKKTIRLFFSGSSLPDFEIMQRRAAILQAVTGLAGH
jgi:hypothetical protein